MNRGFSFGFIAFLAVLLGSEANAQKDGSAMDQTVRKPAVAGQFYADNPEALRKEITAYLNAAAAPAPGGDIVAIVSPHAAYMYSGQVAAYGYNLVRGATYDDVVVIAPSHTEYFSYASVFPGTAYRTPLGDIPIDTDLARLIASKTDLVKSDMKGHEVRPFQRSEHSLEVQLPFLQVALGDFRLVAIVMGDQSARTVEALGSALAGALKGKNVLIVASTDLSHYLDYETAAERDRRTADAVLAFDVDSLGEHDACGYRGLCGLLLAARERMLHAHLLDLRSSGDTAGDRGRVVGYGAFALS